VASRTASLAGSLATLALVATLAAGCGGDDESRPAEAPAATEAGALRYTMPLLNGEEQDLADYEGDVVMVVNTASECGFTPQFEQLQSLYERKRDEGFVILGFPADDVAGQEPRSNGEIAEFCEANYGVEFPMFALVTAEGDDAHPLFRQLGEPDWNFNKYLLDRDGRLVERWGASTAPDDPELLAALDAELES
jgi:glutathione peroxidase